MTTFEFDLSFRLDGENKDPESYLDALFEAGCDDAVVGIGSIGSISLSFTRKRESFNEALMSAIEDVFKAIPDVVLIGGTVD